MMRKVSVCIPAYNNRDSIERLLESVEIQTFHDYEVIITDDSEDDRIQRLIQGKPYVKYYKNVTRLGASANWNEAVKRSSGEYVKIMHHDDWFTDAASLQSLVTLLEEHPEADLAFCGTRQTEAQGFFDRTITMSDAELLRRDYRNLFLGNTIGAPSAVLIRRTEEAYEQQLTWLMDMEYYMRILRNNPHFVYTEEPLISIGVSSSQLTEECRDDLDLNVREYRYIYEKYELHTQTQYRNKMMQVLAEAGKTIQEAKSCGMQSGSYRALLIRKFFSKIIWKLSGEKGMTLLIAAVFCIGLIPVFMLSGVNQATGDDFGYGKLTHAAWNSSHSLPQVCRAAAETVRQFYGGWQGTWLSIFIFTFQPEVLSPHAYVIVPFLMLFILISSTLLLCCYVLVKMAGWNRWTAIGVSLLYLFAALQFIPSTKSGIFWFNGAAHYVLPYAIALLAIFFFLRFIREQRKIANFAGLFLSMLLLGGVNYQAALFAPIVILLLLPCLIWMERTQPILAKRSGRFPLLCMIPLCAEAVGLIISIRSPGNMVRGGEDFGFSAARAAETIIQCFIYGMSEICRHFREHPLLLLLLLLAVLLAGREYTKQKVRKSYPYPLLYILLAYCVYCAMYAPQLYANVEVSGGVHNMNYYVFLMMTFSSAIYLTGWASARLSLGPDHAGRHTGKKRTAAVLGLAGICLFLFAVKGTVKDSTAYLCYDYIKSGQAADFEKQMRHQKAVLLDESIRDAVLPQINDYQGPLMHMPLTENPEAWTNTVTREFYGKNSVIALPAE